MTSNPYYENFDYTFNLAANIEGARFGIEQSFFVLFESKSKRENNLKTVYGKGVGFVLYWNNWGLLKIVDSMFLLTLVPFPFDLEHLSKYSPKLQYISQKPLDLLKTIYVMLIIRNSDWLIFGKNKVSRRLPFRNFFKSYCFHWTKSIDLHCKEIFCTYGKDQLLCC